ncbi:Calcineurin-like phosphoesterase [Methylobacterium sp. ap11]|uniref:metallophosphoesterase family protein n=1 Tax=Methylobacterium sp. ap11 TaxID=1761799 RepID=UPI0008CF9D09|nr:metallophosphoesterase [Methylobacterium sp. ap11]SEP51207.1 Calcineurin-like phosphoesterase [Methylobacterium sp. ap11]
MSDFDMHWLHFTDLHVGMHDQNWLWPEYKRYLFEDFERIASKIAKLDFVIFSGDLVQSGTKFEFDRLDEVLGEIWAKFKQIGSNPQLIHIPGNHDLERPNNTDPKSLLLDKWWDFPQVRQDFFSGKYEYLDFVNKAFLNYSDWSSRASHKFPIPLPSSSGGLLPGDKAYRISISEIKVGVVCLNSTWLQLGGGNYEGKLSIEPRQFQKIVENDPAKWCAQNDVNFIVTHHPTNWLHTNSVDLWNSDINPAGRFDLHFFGHMHESSTSSASSFGSQLRNVTQGVSLFGLEHVEGQNHRRLNGYSVGRISQQNGSRELRMWPRLLRKTGAGMHHLGPDPNYILEEDNSFVLSTRVMPNLKKKTVK